MQRGKRKQEVCRQTEGLGRNQEVCRQTEGLGRKQEVCRGYRKESGSVKRGKKESKSAVCSRGI